MNEQPIEPLIPGMPDELSAVFEQIRARAERNSTRPEGKRALNRASRRAELDRRFASKRAAAGVKTPMPTKYVRARAVKRLAGKAERRLVIKANQAQWAVDRLPENANSREAKKRKTRALAMFHALNAFVQAQG